MAVVNYISAALKTTPASPGASSAAQPRRSPSPVKVILPKKKPMKWSTGVAPGEYGGPPTTLQPRKYWGKDEDPLTSDGFIWNKDFMGRMQRLIRDPDDQSSLGPASVEDESSGFLSISRVMSLDSVEVDLSKELMKPSRSVVGQPVEAATKTASLKWKSSPTRREQDKWDKATKAATGGTEVMLRELGRPQGDPEVLAAQSREQYFKLKKKLQLLTLGFGGVGLVSAYLSYSPEIAASFGVGLVGSLVYMRMLGNTVDSMGTSGANGFVRGAIGQPRLLVPVVLVMIYNRWNSILVPEYGYMHLEIIPMLVGFFTYKIATFYQAIEDAVTLVKRT